jgi:hypothetical protein
MIIGTADLLETRVYNGPVEKSYTPAESPITEFARVIAGRSAVMASGGIKTCMDAEGAVKMGADLVAVGRAVVVDPEWFSKVRSRSEASILAGLPKDEREIAGALSIPPANGRIPVEPSRLDPSPLDLRIGPPGPRKARPDDRLRHHPPPCLD